MAQLLNRLRAEERIAGVEFWHSPERCGWLMKQGEYIKTWRRRWFILKQGKIFWFKTEEVGPTSSVLNQNIFPCLSMNHLRLHVLMYSPCFMSHPQRSGECQNSTPAILSSALSLFRSCAI